MMVALVIMVVVVVVVVGMFIGVRTLINGATMVVAMHVPNGMVMVAAMPVFDESELRRYVGPLAAGRRGVRMLMLMLMLFLTVVRHRRSIPY